MSLYANGPCRILTDIEVRQVTDKATVYKFYVGMNEGKDKDGEYIRNGIDAEAWNKTGEILTQYAGKNALVQMSGIILRQDWIDKETGGKRSKHIFRVNNVELLPRETQGQQQSAPAPMQREEEPFDEEDIPF